MKKIKGVIWAILNLTYLGGLIQLRIKSALLEEGWFKSFKQKESIDKNGNPIAWCTYPFLHFIYPRIQKHFDVFEYGCGNSTIWYASKVKSIKAVEHDKQWFLNVEKKLPANAFVVYRELLYGGNYCKEVADSEKKYHIVIVDGRDRNNCLSNALNNLTEDGVVVFDNSNLKQYQSSINAAIGLGYRKLDFYGMSPIAAHISCTSVIYKTPNCLGI